MLRCTPFLLFDGNCAEAMTFYHNCLGGELTLTKLGDTPMKAQFPPEKYNRIINEPKIVFDKLRDGAEQERLQELHDMPFGIYGQFYDRFGVQWIFKGDSEK